MDKKIFIKLGLVGGILAYFVASKRKYINKYSKENEIRKKLDLYFALYDHWLTLKNKKILLEKYFMENGIQNIAIYGFGKIGKRFYEEIRESHINILYIVDQYADSIKSDIPVLKKSDALEKVDALVVTATYYFDEIKNDLLEKVDFPILSLEEIIYGL